MHCSFCWKMLVMFLFHNQDSEINAKTWLCSNMLQGGVWNLPYTKTWQSCCSASQVRRAYCRKGYVGWSTSLSCDDRRLPSGIPGSWMIWTLCHYPGATSSWPVPAEQVSVECKFLPSPSWDCKCISSFSERTHGHYWAVVQGRSQSANNHFQMHAVFSGKSSILIWISWL